MLIKFCKLCKEKFTVSDGEIQALQTRFGDDYCEPKRCPDCRGKRRKPPRQRPLGRSEETSPDEDFGAIWRE
jgi:hypothetical protein